MRLLLTTDTVGGVWTFTTELAAELCRRGDRVVLAAMGAEPDAGQRAEAGRIPGLDLRVRPYRLEWMDDPWDDLRAAGAWLLDLAAEVRADAVHLNQYAFAILPFGRPTVLTAHSCVLSWWEAVHGVPAPAEWSRYARLVRAGVWSAGRVAAPTAAMAREVERLHGPLSGVAVVPNGRDPAGFRPAACKEPVILAAGRLWDEAKNLAALVRVAPQLPWDVRVAGEGGGSPGGVRPLGRLGGRELAAEMGRASIFVHPALYEPFGLAALEAGLSGCALVLADLPSLREVWGSAALYVDPRRDDELLSALRALCRDPDLRAHLADRARGRAAEYTPARMAREYRAIYRSMIPESGAARALASA